LRIDLGIAKSTLSGAIIAHRPRDRRCFAIPTRTSNPTKLVIDAPPMVRICESPGNAARTAVLSADAAPIAIVACPHLTTPVRAFKTSRGFPSRGRPLRRRDQRRDVHSQSLTSLDNEGRDVGRYTGQAMFRLPHSAPHANRPTARGSQMIHPIQQVLGSALTIYD
jgi:hypothetical protein